MNYEKEVKLFPLNDKNVYPPCQIYQGDYMCKNDYIGGTERKVVTRWDEHDNPTQDSEAVHHLKNHLNHSFN